MTACDEVHTCVSMRVCGFFFISKPDTDVGRKLELGALISLSSTVGQCACVSQTMTVVPSIASYIVVRFYYGTHSHNEFETVQRLSHTSRAIVYYRRYMRVLANQTRPKFSTILDFDHSTGLHWLFCLMRSTTARHSSLFVSALMLK